MTRAPVCQCGVSPHCRVCRQLLVPLLHMINRASGQWSQWPVVSAPRRNKSPASSNYLQELRSSRTQASCSVQHTSWAEIRASNEGSLRFHNHGDGPYRHGRLEESSFLKKGSLRALIERQKVVAITNWARHRGAEDEDHREDVSAVTGSGFCW